MMRWSESEKSGEVNRISYEAGKLLREFFDHADELRCKGIYDVTEITEGFCIRELRGYLEQDGSKASVFLKRFMKLARQFVETDPRYQRRMDEF